MSDQTRWKIARERFQVVQYLANELGHYLSAWERQTWTGNEAFTAKCFKCGQIAIVRLGEIPKNKLAFDLPPICSIEAARNAPQKTHFPGMYL